MSERKGENPEASSSDFTTDEEEVFKLRLGDIPVGSEYTLDELEQSLGRKRPRLISSLQEHSTWGRVPGTYKLRLLSHEPAAAQAKQKEATPIPEASPKNTDKTARPKKMRFKKSVRSRAVKTKPPAESVQPAAPPEQSEYQKRYRTPEAKDAIIDEKILVDNLRKLPVGVEVSWEDVRKRIGTEYMPTVYRLLAAYTNYKMQDRGIIISGFKEIE